MLNEAEKKVIKIMQEKHLLTKMELLSVLKRDSIPGGDRTVQRLKELGYINTVESLGNCLVITPKGLKVQDNGAAD